MTYHFICTLFKLRKYKIYNHKKQLRLSTGYGNRSRDGNQGLSTVQVHSIVRLLFGSAMVPGPEYSLDVRELTDIGKMLLCLLDEYYDGVS